MQSRAHLGLSTEPREDHAQYINSWLRVLKADSPAIFTAASKAQHATDFLTARAGESRISARRGAERAIVAVGHSILISAFYMWKNKQP
jgi:antirestriction protein ArdC